MNNEMEIHRSKRYVFYFEMLFGHMPGETDKTTGQLENGTKMQPNPSQKYRLGQFLWLLKT
jgi:hypothetical protein